MRLHEQTDELSPVKEKGPQQHPVPTLTSPKGELAQAQLKRKLQEAMAEKLRTKLRYLEKED